MDTQLDTISYAYFCRYIFREVMRDLRDTELRVLLTVADKTLGWRKEDDWINRSLLKKLTGKGNTALASAITVLTSHGFIETRDENGRILHSPRERQLYGYTRHNTHFRINAVLVQKAIKYFAEKRTLTRSHSEHYKNISYKNSSSQTNGGEELTPYKAENKMEASVVDQITEWMCRGIYSIQKPREEVYLQVKHTVRAYGVKEVEEIYDRIANGSTPGHPREFWNEIRRLKTETAARRNERSYGLSTSEPESIGDILKNYKLPTQS